MRIVYKTEKRNMLDNLEKIYGIKKLPVPFLLVKLGEEKTRVYTGDFSPEQIMDIQREIGIDTMGLYLLHEYGENIRLSIDGIHLFKEQISKNIIELNEEQAESWFRGEDIIFIKQWEKEEKGFKVLKFKEDLIGCGKLTDNRIVNYMPKERRVKK